MTIRIKNSHASISQALKLIKTKRRIVLTGYPLQVTIIVFIHHYHYHHGHHYFGDIDGDKIKMLINE